MHVGFLSSFWIIVKKENEILEQCIPIKQRNQNWKKATEVKGVRGLSQNVNLICGLLIIYKDCMNEKQT